jgi:transposase-like protein
MNVNELLDELNEIRLKFGGKTPDDESRMRAIVDLLVDGGIYKATAVSDKTSFTQMVENYGARWHEFSGVVKCPHCGSDLCDHENGPPFKREIGIYQWDRTAFYKCPDCLKNFNRFPSGHPYHLSESEMERISKSGESA